MKAGGVRRLGAAAVLAVCLVTFVGQAAADPSQTLAISGDTVSEGAGSATFTVTLTAGTDPSDPTATVDYTTQDGSATAPEDYSTTSGTLTVPAGGSATITVPITNDMLSEGTEAFTVKLSNPSNGTVFGTDTATGTITDNDPAPTLAISGPATVNEDAVTATYSVAITGTSASTVSVNFAASGGTASAGSDFTLAPGTLSWNSGDTAPKQITVTINDDALDELDTESFSLNLSGASGATIGASSVTTSITDNDAQPTTGTFASVSTAEGNTGNHNLVFTVNLSAASGKDITVNFSTVNGSATAPSDYVSQVSQNLVIPAGQLSGNIQISIVGDTVPEPNEDFTVNLNSGTNVTLGADTQATGTITNDDSGVTASINDVTVTEGNAPNTVNATFTVTLSSAAPAAATITYRTTDGSAVSPADYTGVPNTSLPIAQGALSAQITIVVKGDGLPEPSENFFVDLVGSTGPVTIADSRGTGTITDDDTAPSASINDVSVTEGTGGTVNATFTVSLSGPAPAPVQIRYTTVDSSAVAPGDYTAVSNATLNIGPGESSGQLSIVVIGDALPEGTETFFVDISATGATVSRSRGTGTIGNDDVLPVPTIAPASVAEGNSGTKQLVFTVTMPPRGQGVTFDYTTIEGSATASGASPDYQVAGGSRTFAPSDTPLTATIAVTINGDTLDENDETFTLQLTRPAPAGGVAASATGTIGNDDNNSTLRISDSTADEPSTGTATMKFTVTLSAVSGRTVSVNWATAADGTATAGVDYTAGSGALSFGPGDTSKEIVVSVTGDEINEENETVLVNITGAGAGVVDGQGQGTIVDKNAPPSLSISDTVARENGSGAEFTVTLAGTTLRTVTVRFNTSDGTAKAGSDYVARVGTLTFAPGDKTKAIAVTVVDDTAAESAETFFVGLGDPVNAAITKRTGTASIEASDQAPTTPKPPTTPDVKPVAKTTTLLPKMLLGPRSVTVNAGVARMLVTCAKNSPLACSGSVSLERVAKPKLVFGTRKFTVKRGQKAYVRIFLTARALKLLAQRRTMQARAVVVVKTSAKNLTVTPGAITLKQGKPKPKPKAAPTKVVIER